VVNSTTFHPFLPLVATATGERKYLDTVYGTTEEEEDKDEEDESPGQQQNVLSLWCCMPG